MEKAYKLEFANEEPGSLCVNCCGCSRTEPLHSFGPALKPHYTIHYVLSGKGKFSVSGKEYFLEAGYGFLIEPDELVFYQADEEEPWMYVWVGFGGGQAGEYVEKMGLSNQQPVFESHRREELYQAVKDMMEHNTFGIANDLRRNGQLALFLSIVASGVPVKEKDGGEGGNLYVRKAVEFIRSNYCNPIRVADIADYVCINRSYLYALFEDSLHMPPREFLAMYRLTRAIALLQTTEIPIESIALSCGYKDALVFSKAFRQMKGMPPSRYRKEIKSGKSRHDKEQLAQIEAFINQVNKI